MHAQVHGFLATQQVSADVGASGSGQSQGTVTVGNTDNAEKLKALEEKMSALMKEHEAIKAAF